MNCRPSSKGSDAGRADAHERVQHHVAGVGAPFDELAQHPERLLGRVDRVLHPLATRADRGLDEVVHVPLSPEVPGVALVPARDDQLARVQEPGPTELGRRVRLVPDDELERVEGRVEDLVPAAQQVVAREGEQRACGLEDASELREPVGGLERELVPRCDVVVEVLAPRHRDVARGVGAEVVRRVSADQVDTVVRDAREELAAVAPPQGCDVVDRLVSRRRIRRLEHPRIVAVADGGGARSAPRIENGGSWTRRSASDPGLGRVRPGPGARVASGTARPGRRCR